MRAGDVVWLKQTLEDNLLDWHKPFIDRWGFGPHVYFKDVGDYGCYLNTTAGEMINYVELPDSYAVIYLDYLVKDEFLTSVRRRHESR
jgi:hypothetical protein